MASEQDAIPDRRQSTEAPAELLPCVRFVADRVLGLHAEVRRRYFLEIRKEAFGLFIEPPVEHPNRGAVKRKTHIVGRFFARFKFIRTVSDNPAILAVAQGAVTRRVTMT